jgi:hypothetical protein
MKKCTKCNIEKEVELFNNNSKKADGKDNQCKSCRRNYKQSPERAAKIRLSRRNKRISDPEYADKVRAQMRNYSKENPEWYLLTKAKERAKLKGLEFNITVDDIIIPEYCPILEIKLTKGKYKDYQNSPSLDRIDSNKGYIKGNIAVISVLANTMKNKATKELLEKFSKNILKYYTSNIVI